jgi:hypothetical protein
MQTPAADPVTGDDRIWLVPTTAPGIHQCHRLSSLTADGQRNGIKK